MARIKNGVLGGLSGKVGNVVGGNWRGIDYLRSVPTGTRQANTILQQTQRLKFKTVVEFLKTQTDIVRIGFKPDAGKQSGFNVAVSYNYHHALLGDFDRGFHIDYANALLSNGDKPQLEQPGIQSTAAHQLQLNWENNSSEPGASSNDILFVGIFNPDKGLGAVRINPAQRSDGSVDINLPANFSGDLVHCYAGFFDPLVLLGAATRKAVSPSQYLGTVTVA